MKSVAYEHLLEKFGLSDEEIAYIGDDIVDLPILRRVGLPVAVADATDETKAAAVHVTRSEGGRGAVREICELILKAQGKWEEVLDEYHNA